MSNRGRRSEIRTLKKLVTKYLKKRSRNPKFKLTPETFKELSTPLEGKILRPDIGVGLGIRAHKAPDKDGNEVAVSTYEVVYFNPLTVKAQEENGTP
jgi:hypothetical protein